MKLGFCGSARACFSRLLKSRVVYTRLGDFQALLKHLLEIKVHDFEDLAIKVKLLHLVNNRFFGVNLQVGTRTQEWSIHVQ